MGTKWHCVARILSYYILMLADTTWDFQSKNKCLECLDDSLYRCRSGSTSANPCDLSLRSLHSCAALEKTFSANMCCKDAQIETCDFPLLVKRVGDIDVHPISQCSAPDTMPLLCPPQTPEKKKTCAAWTSAACSLGPNFTKSDIINSLKLTANAPENRPKLPEKEIHLEHPPSIFRGEVMLVSGRVCIHVGERPPFVDWCLAQIQLVHPNGVMVFSHSWPNSFTAPSIGRPGDEKMT